MTVSFFLSAFSFVVIFCAFSLFNTSSAIIFDLDNTFSHLSPLIIVLSRSLILSNSDLMVTLCILTY